MTSKEFVRQKYPHSIIEKQVKGKVIGLQEVYYLIRLNRKDSMYFVSGKTKFNAWRKAKEKILMLEKEICPLCNGQGANLQIVGPDNMCPKCNGTGRKLK